MTFQNGGEALKLVDNNTFYEGKMRLAQLDVATTNLDFWFEQEKFFGRSAALVYVDGPSTGASNIYLGGASDNAERKVSGDPIAWAPAVFQLKPDGTKFELYKIKINNIYNTNAG